MLEFPSFSLLNAQLPNGTVALHNMDTKDPMSLTSEQPPVPEKGHTVRTLVEADLLDDRYATTQRGLKNRHVQLMALGGTIGTGEYTRLPLLGVANNGIH